tara:strand:- start:1878 stop:2357 length:480 start_codon:yes stop_codon:yes gene_type:complete
MITILNSELNDDVIKSINELLDKDISPKIAFDLLRITSTLQQIVEDKNNIYNRILKKHATADPENPGSFRVKEELVSVFQKDLHDLDNIKHEFDLDKIKSEELKLEDKIKVKDLYNLKFIFDFELPKVTTTGGENFEENYSISDVVSTEPSEELPTEEK